MQRNIPSRPDNINFSKYHVTKTLVRVEGDVRPGGSRALDGRSCETTNLTRCFAKSHLELPAKRCLE